MSSLSVPAPPGRPISSLRRRIEAGRLPLVVGLYLVSVILPVNASLGILIMTGTRMVLIVVMIPLILRLLGGAYGRLLLTDVLFFLHTLWFILALAVNNPSMVVSNAGSTGIEFLGGYALGRCLIRTEADFIALIRSLSLICLLLSPFVLYETLTGQALILRLLDALPGLGSLPDIDIGKRLGLSRVQTVFPHPILSGLFFITIFSLCFVGMKGIYGNLYRWLIGGLAAGCCFLALSSGAFLALLLQIGMIFWAFVLRNQPKRWLLLMGLFVLAYVTVSLLSNRAPLYVFLSYATFSAHTAYYRMLIFTYGMENIYAHPIFGIGLNDWSRADWMVTTSVDNFWLLTAMRYGIPGFLCLAIGYFWALWRIARRDFDSDPQLWSLRRAWVFTFVGLTLTLITVHVWHTLFSFVFFLFGAGMWMLNASPKTAADADMPSPETGSAAPQGRAGVRYSRFEVKPRQRS